MSTTTIYTVHPETGDLIRGPEFRNAWGSAPRIWRALAESYLGVGFSNWMFRCGEPNDPMWRLDRDERVLVSERITLITTFDRVLIERAHLDTLARAYDWFAVRYPTTGADHLSAMSATFRTLAAAPIAGVGFQMTSVSESLWWVYEEERDDSRPYNIHRDNLGHFWLFETYPELLRPT